MKSEIRKIANEIVTMYATDLTSDRSWARNEEQKKWGYAEHFANIFTTNEDKDFMELKNSEQKDIDIKLTTLKDVVKRLMKVQIR